MSKQEFSIPKLARDLRTEADAYLLLENLRWGGAPDACPKCGAVGRCYFLNPANGSSRKTRTGSTSERRVWKCGHCKRQFSVLTDTIFHGTKIPIRVWLLVIFQFVSSKNSVSAWEISRQYSITNESAWHMLHRIREAMKREPVASLFPGGALVADETWIGGKPSNRHRDDPRELPRKASSHDRQAVFALVHKESREVRSMSVPNVRGATLREKILENANPETTWLETDASTAYTKLGAEMMDHQTVDHAAGQYKGEGGISTNLLEGFFSQLKRSIDGTHHHVSVAHLDRYLAQFDFLYTNARDTDSGRMRTLLGQVAGRRLTYKPLTGIAE